jgi:3-hydroxyisobutyrate dehydrogenase-like beta-hydroxyacid dehydrogenase
MTTGRRKYTVGFIGIGKMGLPMANRIAAHGSPFLNGKKEDKGENYV